MPAVSNISSVRYDHKTPNFQPQPSHIRSISNSDVSMKSSPHRRVLSELSPNVSRTTPTGTTKAAVFDKQSPSQKKPALNCLLENSSSPLRTEKSNSSHQDIIGPRTDAARNSRNGAIRKRTIDEVDNPEGRKICHLAVKERTLEVSLSHTERVKSIEVPDKEPSSSATTNKSHGTSFSSIINYEASTGEDDDNTTSATLPTIVESIASEDENMQVATSAKEVRICTLHSLQFYVAKI